MFVFVDPFNRGLSHAPFNAGLIETLHAAEPGRQMVVAAEADHLAGLAELVDPALWLRTKQIPLAPAPAGSSFRARLAIDYRLLRQVFSLADKGARLVIADLAPATLYALRLNAMLRPSAFASIAAVLHGNAAELAGWRARNPLIRATQLRAAMGVVPTNCRFLVLEDAIRRALGECVPEHSSVLATLPHPIPTYEGKRCDKAHDDPSVQLAGPIRIAFLGAAQEKKGFGTFLALAQRLVRQYPERVEFDAIGWLPPESAGLDLSCLTRRPSLTKINRAEFLSALDAVDYVCLPYDQELYRFSASGTLLDAVSARKPVIALRSPLLEDLQAEFGNIGVLANDFEQLASMTERLIQAQKTTDYQQQVATMSRICSARMPQNLAERWLTLFPDHLG